MARIYYQTGAGFGGGVGVWSGGFNVSGGWYDPFRAEWQREQLDILQARRSAARITASRELPGTAHYLPRDPVPVGNKTGGDSVLASVINASGGGLPGVGVRTPDFRNEGQPSIIYSPPPIVLPGQVDPGREEQEEGENDVAHTITHFVQQGIGAIFGGPEDVGLGFGGPAQGFVASPGQAAPAAAAVSAAYSGSCPPRKTRTLTIDCATGLEIKRPRRRRKALLTQGDLGVLFQIATLPNSANVRTALAGAIRR